MGWMTRVQFLEEAEISCLLQVETGSGAHPAIIQWVMECLFHGRKVDTTWGTYLHLVSRLRKQFYLNHLRVKDFSFLIYFTIFCQLHRLCSIHRNLCKNKIYVTVEFTIISQHYTICRCGYCVRNLKSVGSPISLQGSRSCFGNSTWAYASHWGWLCSVLWLRSSWSWLCCCSTCGLLLWWCWPWQPW